MKTEKVSLALVALFLAVLLSVLAAAAGPTSLPIVDGCFYGACNDEDNYELWGTALNERGYLYGLQDGTTLYLAVVVSPATVNNNLFGPDAYTGTGGWSASHRFDHLEQSDNVQLALSCGSSSWTWGVDYIYDADEGVNYDWQSGTEGPDGDEWCSEEHGITCGYPSLVTAGSSLVWNVSNTTWPYTQGSTTNTSQWQSVNAGPDSDAVTDEDGWGTTWYDSVKFWEWAMVYEMSLDVSQCGDDEIYVEVWSAHNSPSMDGDEDIPIAFYDFGDDPDTTVASNYTFPTMLADDGARHKLIVGGPFMGAIVDKDPNGQPAIGAVGDDEDDEADDEDGLCCWSTLVPGEDAHVYALMHDSPADCRLNAWIDFDGSGDWDSSEQIFNGAKADELEAGACNQLTFPVPANAVTETPLYTRWRCSTDKDLEYDGAAPDGEVEDYVVRTTDEGPMDLGDLPDDYGTLLGSSGPYHLIVPGFSLGAGLDDEMDGHPSEEADGDDLCPPTGGDDEDGIDLPDYLTPGDTVTIEVFLTNSAGYVAPVLNAWVDSDGNGLVQVLENHPLLLLGSNSIELQVPAADAGAGSPIYLRFRLTGTPPSSLRNPAAITQVGPTGREDNGEVEDYVRRSPTGVILASFEAAPQGQAIEVTWVTGSEVDVLGFNLYRAQSADGARTQLNADLIPAKESGNPVGASYEYLDGSVTEAVEYFYWLEMVDVHGGKSLHGPASAEIAPRYDVFLPLIMRQ